MQTFKFPLSIPLVAAGVTERDFLRHSELHGMGHVNRVALYAILLARTCGAVDIIPAAWAAAHLHDLARLSDGVCSEHGERAVYSRLQFFLPLYRAAGVKTEQIPAICTAVALHCRDVELTRDHPHFRVWVILKDADALDRVRLGDLDRSRLRLPRSRDLIPLATALHAATSSHATFVHVWDTMQRLVARSVANPDDHPYFFDPTESPRERMERRLRQASSHPDAVIASPSFWNPDLPVEVAIQELAMDMAMSNAPISSRAPIVLKSIEEVSKIRASAQRLRPFTATRRLADFVRDGRYLGFNESGPSWHYIYTDDPLPVRLHHSLRLFGERDAFVTYGVLLDPADAAFTARLEELHATYGPDVIEWSPSILADCTFCLNDSQKQPCVLPFHVETYVKALFLDGIRRHLHVNLPKELLPWQHDGIFFIEFQCHRPLTISDMTTSMHNEVSHPLLTLAGT